MLNKVLETPIDTLVKIVKENENCSISFIKNKLSQPLDIIEKWLVILEEYKILKVEYKGFEGYVKFTEKSKIKKTKTDFLDLENLKESFIEKSKNKKIPYSKMKEIWPIFIERHEEKIKKNFFEKSKVLKHNSMKTQKAWIKFKIEMGRF